MTSILRLGSKDRSSFLFRRHGTDSSGDSAPDLLAHRLPELSRVDTRSLLDLFDDYNRFEHLEALPRLQTNQHSTTSKPQIRFPAVAANGGTNTVKSFNDDAVQHLNVDLVRNESTSSSSYSQPSQRNSDYSPLVTRNSSSSSYVQESSHDMSEAPSLKPDSLTLSTRSALSPAIRSKARKIPPAGASAEQLTFPPPNLDKPLPPGPHEPQKASISVPDLLLRPVPAELASHELTVRSDDVRPPSFRSRSASARRTSDGQALAELPSWRSKSVQDHRVRHVKVPNTSQLPLDADAPRHAGVEIEKHRRHTADILVSNSLNDSKPKNVKARRRKLVKPISASTAERVIYKIMCNLHSLEDLRSMAMVSKGFYRTFHRNESNLVSHLIFKTSRPAWEFRRSVLALKGSTEFVLKDYRRDCKNLTALKAFIVAHCGPNCKRDVLVGLLGQSEGRTKQIDNALWRISTFCSLFGNSQEKASPPQAELDWLNGSRVANKNTGAGFAVGNGSGLNTEELEDMIEIWQCLQRLLSGFEGREADAKKAGIFDNWHLRETTTAAQHLGEWICYLLTLGPQTILALSSCSFEQARMLGLTRWPAPAAGRSRSFFLTAAITQVYQERLLEAATLKAARFSITRIPPPPPAAQPQHQRKPSHRPTRSFDERQLATLPVPTTVNQTQSLRIDTTVMKRRPISMIAQSDARLDIRPDCDPASDVSRNKSPVFPATPTADPTVFYTLGMTPTASTKLGATLFPVDYVNPGPRVPFRNTDRPHASTPGVVDPVDRAMKVLVRDLGFSEVRARKALAMCDTGSGIDLEKAIELLTIDSKDAQGRVASPVELPTPSMVSSGSPDGPKRRPKALCDGHCSPSSPSTTAAAAHRRQRSTGTATDASISPISIGDEAEWQDKISPLVTPANSTVRPKKLLGRGASKGVKAWKALGMESAPKRKNSVLGIEEYQAKVERRKSVRAGMTVAGARGTSVKEGLGKNLLGLGLGIGSAMGQKSAEQQLQQARDQERRKKEKTSKIISMPRYA
ncbi:hypothetical protein PV08_04109 [Exophiala spinifera]|uniref:UBA domain-containing protein n=1 Tax=Exophiala spinifera TaxID=91928 RepID=A0A0D2BZY7_9EURO|nr:uncharacterized protein PV08_04109 [Exophiala spinifera]KIW16919.1 hypothetical protein PV08_04109 [Exophiala spinifera]